MRNRMLIGLCLGWLGVLALPAAGLEVLCTTFPVYQLTRNVVGDRTGVRVQLLLPASLGCPHDYALTPLDMRKLADADVLVVNGLGLEEFLGAPLQRANAKIAVVDSSAGLATLLDCAACAQGDHAQGHTGASPAGVNPHLFASPRQAARLAVNIAEGLAGADPAGAGVYRANARAYAVILDALAEELAALGKTLRNNRLIQPHGVFDYLAHDAGLEIVGVMQAHGQEPSAADMLALIALARAKNAGAIFTEPQYPEKVGRTLARETGLPVAVLDPAATGPEDASLDYYTAVMRKNMDVLRATLGVRHGETP